MEDRLCARMDLEVSESTGVVEVSTENVYSTGFNDKPVQDVELSPRTKIICRRAVQRVCLKLVVQRVCLGAPSILHGFTTFLPGRLSSSKSGHQQRMANTTLFSELLHAGDVNAGLSLRSSTHILPLRRARWGLCRRVLQGTSRRSNRASCSGGARHEVRRNSSSSSSSRGVERPRGEKHRSPRWWRKLPRWGWRRSRWRSRGRAGVSSGLCQRGV